MPPITLDFTTRTIPLPPEHEPAFWEAVAILIDLMAREDDPLPVVKEGCDGAS